LLPFFFLIHSSFEIAHVRAVDDQRVRVLGQQFGSGFWRWLFQAPPLEAGHRGGRHHDDEDGYTLPAKLMFLKHSKIFTYFIVFDYFIGK
jgi:hypothetical protein